MASRERERRRKATLRAEHRKERRSRTNLRRQIKRYLLGGIVGLGGLMIVLSLILPSSGGPSSGAIGGETSSAEQGVQIEIQGSEEIAVGQGHPAYSTSPPTSGWLYDIPLEEITWGPRGEPVENEVQVSYLERGGVMIQYNCPDGCPRLQEQIELVVNRYPEGVILAPYPDMAATIALTSWGWIDTFEKFDDPRIDAFIQTHIGLAPKSFR